MTDSDRMACKEFVEIVTEYLEGSMSPEQHARFEAHLQVCSGCHTYLEQIRQTIRAAGKLSEQNLSPEAQDVLLKAFRDWNKQG